jgi:hypothetical protein
MKLLLIPGVLLAYSLHAEKLDITISVNDQQVGQSVDFSADVQEFDFNDKGVHCKGRIVSQDEEGLTVQTQISVANAEGQLELISEPVLNVAWNKQAEVKVGDELSVTVNASK